MNTLLKDTSLQNERYKIIDTLGQGGFGITYLALQTGLDRKVAIKEFFMKDLCNRDETTSHISVGSNGSIEMVNRFKTKFLKEARNIARLNHQHIVRILDVFEENGTAYYVMEYAEGGSLAEKVKRCGALPESEAVRYILQVADALGYIHEQKMNHLDIKPANIMLNAKDDAILIDFGLSKQYDAETGSQTSTTPVGISEGYAPMEQYKQGGVQEFSPETDIYALGATLFKLLTGITPPSASDVNEDGVPVDELREKGVSQDCIVTICKAMEGRKRDRMKDVQTFINGLKADAPRTSQNPIPQPDEESTRLFAEQQQKETEVCAKAETERKTREEAERRRMAEEERRHKEQEKKAHQEQNKNPYKVFLWIGLAILVIAGIVMWNTSDFGNQNASIGNISSSPSTFTVNGVSFTMMPVVGGTFRMGATESMDSDADGWESPIHDVTLSDYYIGKTEVTQALWHAVMGSNPSFFKGDNLPVEKVSWQDCQEFIKKLNEKTGKSFRLPTEAEWEYAARGGQKCRGYKYCGSNDIDAVACYFGNSNKKTHPVAIKQPNELGIYDMSGNVWEWCSDWFGDYSSNAQTNPNGSMFGDFRVLRGGCWDSNAKFCRSTNRRYDAAAYRLDDLGFRLVLPVK